MRVSVPQECFANERRVAATPATVAKLVEIGFAVTVEAGAGVKANYSDEAYRVAGAEIVTDTVALWSSADILLKVRPPCEHAVIGRHEVDLLSEGAVLICFIWPAANGELLDRLAARGVTTLAMDAVPRVTRAQKMDALSSMALIAGYRAVVTAAHHFGSFFAGQMTAAGKVRPATVLVIGAGVAGLAAIAAARGLGAIVRAFDTRAAAADQVRSLGAEFLQVDFDESGEGQGGYAKVMSQAFIAAEMALFREQAKQVDIVVTTALIPGKPAPKLWDASMVSAMKPGSVVVDLAAQTGGNCALTEPGKVVVKNDVTIVGWTDYTGEMAHTASQLYGTNLVHVLDEMGRASDFRVDLQNAVIRGALVTHQGQRTWPPPELPKPAPTPPAAKPRPVAVEESTAGRPDAPVVRLPAKSRGGALLPAAAVLLAAAWIYLRLSSGSGPVDLATAKLVQHLTVFVLACFVGWQVIWNVTPALHTPLMSVTNAISGIIILGGLLQGAAAERTPMFLGAVAVLVAMINISGGFLVTQRMLRMFRK